MLPEGKAALAAVIVAMAIVVGGAWVAIGEVVKRAETARKGRTVIDVRTPEVAPGDGIVVRVIVRGGKKAGIEEVTVKGGEEVLRVKGKGKDWGWSFRARAREGGMDEEQIVVEVPRDAVPGTTMTLRFEVQSVTAETTGRGGFRAVYAVDVVEVDVPVLTAAQRGRKRMMGAGVAVIVLVALAIAAAIVTPVVARRFRRRPQRMARGVEAALVVGAAVVCSLAVLTAAVTYGFVGWFYFARRIVASTAVLDAWFPWVMLAVWVLVPGVVVVAAWQRVEGEIAVRMVAARRVGASPFRGEVGASVEVEARPIGDVAEALAAAGMTVRRRGRRLAIREDGEEVVLRVAGGEVGGWTRTPMAALAAARAIVPVMGPLEVELGGLGSVIVDGTKDRAALANELDAVMQRRIADVMAALAPLQRGGS